MNPNLERMWEPAAVHPEQMSVREHYRHQERQLLDRALFYIARNLLTADERVLLHAGLEAIRRETQ